jgi:hypothetical protein
MILEFFTAWLVCIGWKARHVLLPRASVYRTMKAAYMPCWVCPGTGHR